MQISFHGLYENNLQELSLKNVCNPFPYSSHKVKNYQNRKTESGSKQRFSLLQDKVVIQAVCRRAQGEGEKAI